MAQWDVTTSGSNLEFDTNNGTYNSCFMIDSNHFINFWVGWASTNYIYAQVFTVNTSTWAVTTANNNLQIDATTVNGYNSCCQIDSNHFINFWSDDTSDGFVQVFTVNTSTWAVTTANSALEFDTENNLYNSCYQIDSNHFINIWWGGALYHSYAQVFTVNTSTWAVTTANSALEFDTQYGGNNSCLGIDSNHFIIFWSGYSATFDMTGSTVVLEVNTSTWAVTTANSKIDFDIRWHQYSNTVKMDTNHFIHKYDGQSSGVVHSYIQTFEVNTSTWVVTNYTRFDLGTTTYTYGDTFMIDSNHLIDFTAYESSDGYAQVFTVNTSTWDITTSSSSLEFDTQNGTYNSCYRIDTNHFIDFWAGLNSDGYVQTFNVEYTSFVSYTGPFPLFRIE